MSRMRNAHITDAEIIAEYQRLSSSNKTASSLDVTERRVCLVLRKYGIPRVGLESYRKAAQRYPEGVQAEIRRLHDEGVSQADLRKRFGGSDYSIRRAIVRSGGEIKAGITSRKKVSQDDIKLICELYTQGLSQDDVSDRVGFSQAVIGRILKENGVRMRRGSPAGPAHHRWGGGTWTTGDGYIRMFVEDDSPFIVMRDRSGYALQHRLVMARKIGRPLLSTETVHHINGDRSDNRVENLQLRQGRHGKHVVLCCLDCGSRNVGPVSIYAEEADRGLSADDAR